MQSPVWFTDLSARPGNSLPDKTGALLRAAGRDPFRETHPSVDWAVQLECGEEIGLGTRSYRLETL
ncbi:MAG: hypothetical protein H6Q80_684 [Deltaproteobacteria bacterium]|jgi:uncharacterized Fe-S center protein|nr:hypothetical protein [Deltaproteobacteria bacterium]